MIERRPGVDREQSTVNRQRAWRRHLLTGAFAAITLVVALAIPWPFGLLVVAGMVGCLGALARTQVLPAVFVSGVLFLLTSGLVQGGLTGQAWVSPAALAGLEVGIAAVGVAAILVPATRR
jgi:hypothetical protein